jgi:hypothetical protein
MPANLPDFEKAEYPGQPAAPVSEAQSYNAEMASRAWDAQSADRDRFVHALLYGAVAAVAGSIAYAAFTIVTHIQIGYLAVGVGYIVGKAMLHATHGLGGRKYQITAAVLTYLAVSMAAVPEILWTMHARGMDISHISSRGVVFLAQYGIASPFLELRQSLGGGLIGLFILFIGIRAAWNFTADRRIAP